MKSNDLSKPSILPRIEEKFIFFHGLIDVSGICFDLGILGVVFSFQQTNKWKFTMTHYS
jgi:hypothetical protein